MKKYFISMILVLSVTVFSFAENGLMYGQKNIKYVSTNYFTIIYPEASAQSAAELTTQADAIFEDICAGLGAKNVITRAKLPVVISPATEQFNAYYTNDMYNHIVLYDAVPEDDMAVNDNVIVDTFKHELTHFVTINMRNTFWRNVDSVFGDEVNWGCYVTMPSLIKEGAAVAYESKDGTGRLNDEYYLHLVRQAKIEKQFPSWADVTGVMDVYPYSNSAYAFGGPFTEWLQKKFGMEKYAEYWYRAVNMKSLTFATSFKKVFGVSISNAWKEFEASIEVPEINANPLAEDGFGDFFSFIKNNTQNENQYSKENSSGSLYSSMTESDKGIAFVDGNSSAVFYAALDENTGLYGAPKKLFTMFNKSRISISKDGALLAVSVYGINHMNIKNEVYVYNMKTGALYKLPDTGLRDATIICNGGAYYVAAVKTESQNVSLAVYSLSLDSNARSVKDAELVQSIPFPRGDVAYSLCDAGNGTVGCIYKTAMTWSIRMFGGLCVAPGGADTTSLATADTSAVSGGQMVVEKTVALPLENMRIRNLSLVATDNGQQTFAFTWTSQNTLPRLGYLVLGEDSGFELMDMDVSGGVYYPVAFRCADSNRGQLPSVAYVGSFYEDRKILVVNSAKVPFSESSAVIAERTISAETSNETATTFDEAALAAARPYHKLYGPDGMLIPWASVPQFTSMFSQSATITFPGLTWITSNPWDADSFAVSGGYDYVSDTGGVLAEFSGGSSTSLFSYVVQPEITFDANGFKQFVNYAAVQSGFLIGKVTSLSLIEQNFLLLGRQHILYEGGSDFLSVLNYVVCAESLEKLCGIIATNDQTQYVSAVNQIGGRISNIHYTGPGTYEKLGASLSAVYQIAYKNGLQSSFSANHIYQSIYPTVTVNAPWLLPIKCTYGSTYNLPLTATVSLYPNSLEFLQGEAEAVLYSKEIQKGVTFFPIYFNRVTVTTSYAINIFNANSSFAIAHLFTDVKNIGSMELTDSIAAKVLLDVSGNTGGLAQSGRFAHVGVAVTYYPRSTNAVPVSVSFTNSMLF